MSETQMKDSKIVVIEGKDVYDIRAFYRKEGRAKYISHLDLYRTIQRAFSRSKLPVWFTLGFNPHIYLTFALPLPLGCEGVRESFDFRLTDNVPMEAARAALCAAMPEGIVITELTAPICKPEAIVRADYTLEFSVRKDGVPFSPEELMERFTSFLAEDSIPTIKHSKKGPKTIDLKKSLFALQKERTQRGLLLTLTLPAGGTENIAPSLLADAFSKSLMGETDYLLIRRNRILKENGEEFA